jgi:hypothetical protein
MFRNLRGSGANLPDVAEDVAASDDSDKVEEIERQLFSHYTKMQPPHEPSYVSEVEAQVCHHFRPVIFPRV